MTAVKEYEMKMIDVTPEQMDKRVARYDKLEYPPDRYPDSLLPGHERRNYLVVGTGLIVDGAVVFGRRVGASQHAVAQGRE